MCRDPNSFAMTGRAPDCVINSQSWCWGTSTDASVENDLGYCCGDDTLETWTYITNDGGVKKFSADTCKDQSWYLIRESTTISYIDVII